MADSVGRVKMNREESRFEWSCSVPIFKDPLIVKQLWVAIGIPFGLIILMIAVLSKGSRESFYAIGMILSALLLTVFFVKVVYKGRYEVEYKMDASGIRCKYASDQLKKNRWINGLTVFLGLLSRNPAAAGAGFLAQSRQDVSLKWIRVQSVKYVSKQHRIHLKAGWLETVVVYCHEENYSQVSDCVKSNVRI